jgi:hypothetical protein
MGSSIGIPLIVPRWQVDPTRLGSLNRFATPNVREELKARLLSDDYSIHLKQTGEVNKIMTQAIMEVVGERDMENAIELDTEVEEATAVIPKRRLAVELLLSVTTRLRNQNILNFFIAVLSVIALSCNLCVRFWSLLSSMKVLFSRVWTINLVREIGSEITSRKRTDSSKNIGLYVTDNKAYFKKLTYMHTVAIDGVTDGAPKANGEFLHSVNNVQVNLEMPNGDIDVAPGT